MKARDGIRSNGNHVGRSRVCVTRRLRLAASSNPLAESEAMQLQTGNYVILKAFGAPPRIYSHICKHGFCQHGFHAPEAWQICFAPTKHPAARDVSARSRDARSLDGIRHTYCLCPMPAVVLPYCLSVLSLVYTYHSSIMVLFRPSPYS